MVDGTSFDAAKSDAAAPNTATGLGKVPHSAKPVVRLTAKASWTLTDGVIRPSAILANLSDNQPNVLQLHSPADCHARIAKYLVWASQHWIEAAPDRQHFCMLPLCLKNDFTKHLAMTVLL